MTTFFIYNLIIFITINKKIMGFKLRNKYGDVVDAYFGIKESEINDNIKNNKINIIRHSRQMGMSTLLNTLALENATLFNNKKILFIYNNMSLGSMMHDSLLKLIDFNGLNDLVLNKVKNEVFFNNGSSITFKSSGSDVHDIRQFSWVIFDGYVSDNRNVLHFSNALINKNINITIAATPWKRDKTDFSDLCLNSMVGISPYKYSEYLWWDNPRFSEDLVLVKNKRVLPIPENKEHLHSLLCLGFKHSSKKYEEMVSYMGIDGVDYALDCMLDV